MARAFFITYAAANLSLVLYGLMALALPDVLLEPFTQHVYEFPADASEATRYLSALYRLLGYFNLLIGGVGLYLLYRFRADRRNWQLGLLVVGTALAYVGPIVFDNTVGTIGAPEIVEHVLFVLVIVVGILAWRRRLVLTV